MEIASMKPDFQSKNSLKLRILFVAPSYSKERGGVPYVLHKLATQLNEQKNLNVDLVVTNHGDGELYPKPPKGKLFVFKGGIISKIWTGFSLQLTLFLIANIRSYDLIHIHELWHYPGFIAYLNCRLNNIPYVVSTHGELDEWCLKHKMIRKMLYSTFIQKHILKNSEFIQVATRMEKISLEQYLDNDVRNVVIIPNGVDLRELKSLPMKNVFRNKYSGLSNKKIILFLSRIHPKKGIDILIKSFAKLDKIYENLALVIAGPDDPSYKAQILKVIDSLGLRQKIFFPGMLKGEEKLAAYNDAEVFVLPSYAENFGIVVVEAMAIGTPVVISDKVGLWHEIQDYNAGIVVKVNPESVADGITRILEKSDLRKDISYNAKTLVKEFALDLVAQKLTQFYHIVMREKKDNDMY